MGDDVSALGREGQLQNHIIVRIGKKRPPKELNILQPCVAGQKTQKCQRVLCVLPRRQMLAAGEHILPLGIQAHRKADLKMLRRNAADQSKAGPFARMHGGNENGSIQSNPHASFVAPGGYGYVDRIVLSVVQYRKPKRLILSAASWKLVRPLAATQPWNNNPKP